MQFIPMALMAAGSIVQGIGGMQAGRHNQHVLNDQALEEARAGEVDAGRIRDQSRQAIGEQIAAQFGNGMTGGSGSALDALAESQINAALDVMTIRRDAAAKARSLQAQGKQAATEGKFALASGILGAAKSVIGTSHDWAAAKRGS